MPSLHVTIITALLIMALPVVAGETPAFSLKSEYRHDALDYGSRSSWFFRQKMLFQQGSTMAGAGVTRRDTPAVYSITGCAVFSPEQPFWTVTTGHFYANFGTGLLIGKGNSFNPDPFSSRPVTRGVRVFTPCFSGNPLYAFRGMGVSLRCPAHNEKVSINTFHSVQERYTTSSMLEDNATTQSHSSLLSRTRPDGKYTQPVTIRTTGASLSLRPGSCMLLQGNYYTARITHDKNRRMSWQLEENDHGSSAIRLLRGAGYYACYHDGMVTAFIEQCWSFNRVVENHVLRQQRSSGLVTGMRYRGSMLSMGAVYKKTAISYAAPLGNALGSHNPEEVYTLECAIKPRRYLETGITLDDENSLSPSSYYGEFPHTRRQSWFFSIERSIFSVDATLARRSACKKGIDDTSTREKIKLTIDPPHSLSLSTRILFQQKSSTGYSYLAGADAEYDRWMNCSINGGLLWFSAPGANPLYATLLQLPGTSIPFMYLKGRGLMGACRITFSRGIVKTWLRVLYPLYQVENTATPLMEFALTAEF